MEEAICKATMKGRVECTEKEMVGREKVKLCIKTNLCNNE